jgi:hypothetical protein
MGTHGPFTFAPGDTFSLTTAFTLHLGIPHPCPDIMSTVMPALEQFRDWSAAGLLAIVQEPGQVVLSPPGQRTTIHAGVHNAASYAWSTSETTPTITVEKTGLYTVTITATTGCQIVHDVLVRFEAAGKPPQVMPEFYLMPNPADSYIGIGVNCPECPDSIRLRATLHNAHGQLVHTALQPNGEFFRIATHNLPAGFYVLQLWQDALYLGTRKVVIARIRG